MNIKIQGGGSGKFANKGSSFAAADYLRHEDEKRKEQGHQVEPFFNQSGKRFEFKDMVSDLDQNKAKLSKKEAKFFAITVSPSAEEQRAMGDTPQERSENLKKYVRENVMQQYAENFNKGLSANDIKYYSKIHHERPGKEHGQMHAHILVSRKDMENRRKLSPMTNHRGTGRTGTAKGGFDREQFVERCEKTFDKQFSYGRELEESFEYQNTMKHGTGKEKTDMLQRSADILSNKELERYQENKHYKKNQELEILDMAERNFKLSNMLEEWAPVIKAIKERKRNEMEQKLIEQRKKEHQERTKKEQQQAKAKKRERGRGIDDEPER